MTGCEILTVSEMAEADKLAVASGVPSLTLMENAGRAVADEVEAHYLASSIVVLSGPGNNGGDGFAAARHLRDRGYEVVVGHLGPLEHLKGDAAEMARRWQGEVAPLTPNLLDGAAVVIDALFGAGLSRPLDGLSRAMVAAMEASGLPVVAVDVPSGVHGDLGRALDSGGCVRAQRTVTFFRKKPAHVLLPGRAICGQVTVADIGIPDSVLNTVRPQTFDNQPELWLANLPWPNADSHKYKRGHAVIVSGPPHATGAARLAARGALRAGAGLVSVASSNEAIGVNAAHLTAIMVKPANGAEGLRALLADRRFNAVALGPGLGVGGETKALTAAALSSSAAVVLDADALTSFSNDAQTLLSELRAQCVLTPHQGEFERLFPQIAKGAPSKLAAAREAAKTAGCVVLLKGADSVIASPDGRAAINSNAPPWLATAGSGDVLTGIITGLLAQRMDAFDAASAAAWLHGDAAARFGIGLIAEDIPEQLPKVFAGLQQKLQDGGLS